jgi:hypothetical protein
MAPTNNGIKPEVAEEKPSRPDTHTLKSPSRRSHQEQFRRKQFAQQALGDPLALTVNIAEVFAHEVGNPLYGLSAALQGTLLDLADKKLDVPVIQATIQGALLKSIVWWNCSMSFAPSRWHNGSISN